MYLTNVSEKTKIKLTYIVSFVAGILSVFGFAPFDWPVLSILAITILCLLYSIQILKNNFYIGFMFGFGMFGFGVSWIYISIHEYGNVHAILAGFITLIFISFLASLIGLHGYFFNKFAKKLNYLYIFTFALLWVVIEWFRGWFLTGFPWLYLGYSQVDGFFQGLIPVIGIFGTSFIITLSSGFLALIIQNIKKPLNIIIPALFIVNLITIAKIYEKAEWVKEINPPIKVTIIQGNIAQELKWTPKYLEKTLNIYQTLTDKNWDSDLIVWPEAAIPVLKHHADEYLDSLAKKAKETNTTMIIGIPVQNSDDTFYNSLVMLGQYSGIYHKQYLVPFGEFVPFKKLLGNIIKALDIPMSDFSVAPQNQENLSLGNIKIAPFICYEIAFSSALLDFRKDANLLVTLSNDAWFGESLALAQHLQIAQSRSLQAGKYQIVATNTGISAVINHKGKIIAKALPFTETSFTTLVKGTCGKTPWTQFRS